MKYLRAACAAILFCASLASLTGCSTPTPPVGARDPAGISFDGGIQNAGIIDLNYVNNKPVSFIVTPGYRDRYNTLWAKYGTPTLSPKDPFTPFDGPLIGNQFTVTFEGAAAYEAMLRRSKLP